MTEIFNQGYYTPYYTDLFIKFKTVSKNGFKFQDCQAKKIPRNFTYCFFTTTRIIKWSDINIYFFLNQQGHIFHYVSCLTFDMKWYQIVLVYFISPYQQLKRKHLRFLISFLHGALDQWAEGDPLHNLFPTPITHREEIFPLYMIQLPYHSLNSLSIQINFDFYHDIYLSPYYPLLLINILVPITGTNLESPYHDFKWRVDYRKSFVVA